MRAPVSLHPWKFFRTGGLDQVALENAEDLLHLDELDQKLWIALSCPVNGLEIDPKTLAMIDTDKDGRIRVPELVAAIKWAAERLKDPGELLAGRAILPVASIQDTTLEGRTLVASARQILSRLGRADSAGLTPAQTSDTAAIFGAGALNGDGIITPEASDDPAVQALIKDIMASIGTVKDRAGTDGINAAMIEDFYQQLANYSRWVNQSAAKDIAVLGEGTAAAVAAMRVVRAKVDDYFGRCRLAAFDARATAALNRAESEYLSIAAKDLKISADEVSGFPLARIEAHRPLPLLEGVNPAWAAALATLHKVAVAPVLGVAKNVLTEAEWTALNQQFAAYEAWLGDKNGGAVEKLGITRIKEILASPAREKLADLVARDKALEPEFTAMTDVDRLVHYHRDLRALVHNFVNFADFYSRDRYAIFQAGTLFLDSRSTELTLKVEGPNPLAAMSRMYIVYCTCTRIGSASMNIAACITQGDSDYLFVGRHGIFYDRKGQDWDAVVTSIVDNPISLRQAFWSPYKKFIRMIEEQVAKRAAAAEAASSGKLSAVATDVTHAAPPPTAGAPAPAAPPPAAPRRVDVGTVAALGVAVGAIGGALATLATGLARLAPWQLPLVVLAVILAISLPSMVIAWLKIRQRTLGPILDGNGWAINGRVKVNMPLGLKLTHAAHLPPKARRSLDDPYEDKDARRRRRIWFVAVLLLIAGVVVAWKLGTWPF